MSRISTSNEIADKLIEMGAIQDEKELLSVSIKLEPNSIASVIYERYLTDSEVEGLKEFIGEYGLVELDK